MKKLLLCLLLALSLSGCGQTSAVPAAPESGIPAGTGQTASAEDRTPTAQELGREETTDLTFLIEGTEETLPAALYIGQGYSLYIPTEGWALEHDTEDGIPVDSWESTVNDNAELRVLHLGQKTQEEARAWVTAEEDDYRLTEDQQGGLFGEDPEDRMCLDVRFHEARDQLYAVLWEYPLEAAEGFGCRLGVIADTFELMQ